MKRVLAILFGAAVLFAGFGVADVSAAPGPNGSNDHGLCTAYFNGQKNGHTEGEGPGPFGTLEDVSEDDGTDEEEDPDNGVIGETRVASDVRERCDGLIGGNPELNGRFDCSDDEDDKKAGTARDVDEDGQFECWDNT
jgi:hypothetical protein